MTLFALTRAVSPSLAECELTHLAREPIDIPRAVEQHAAYETLLGDLGATVVRVPPAPALPDAVFIEDTAIVLDEVAVITRPGAVVRRAELEGVAAALGSYRPLVSLTAPATLDGGDVFRAGQRLYVGRSSRTNDEGIEQLRRATEPYGMQVIAVEFQGCLHLKSAVTTVADDVLLVNPDWVSAACFRGFDCIAVDPREPHGANILRVGASLVYSSAYPRTAEVLGRHGFVVSTVDCSELVKAEGAVTCCSLVFNHFPAHY
ncbi:MAG: dimethylargininase [Gemmatimonadota bacterium]